MASIHLQGTLVDSLGEIDVGAIMTFTHLTNTGETIATTKIDLIIPPNGFYSIDVEYGQIRIDYTTRFTERFIATVIVNQDSTATTIPELLNAAVPVTDPVILEMQDILADAVAAADTSEAFADQLTTTDLIGSVATYDPDTNFRTKGYLTSGDGGAGHWVQNGVTAQPVSQSPEQLGDALLNDGNGNQWVYIADIIQPLSLGFSTSNADNTSVFNAIKKASIGGTVHKSVQWPAGDFTFTQSISISPSDSINLTTSVRNITWQGAGGMGLDLATRFKFEIASSTDCITFDSPFNLMVNDICFRTSNDCETIVKLGATSAPDFSGSIMEFNGCHFQLGGAATSTEASVFIYNQKLVQLNSCYLTAGSTDDVTVVRLGDDAANQAGTLQQGVLHNARLNNCFIFGRVDIRNCKQWSVDNCTFGEKEHARIVSTGDQRMQSGRLVNTSFIGDSEYTAFTQGNYVNTGDTGEEAGWITIENCEFRDRKIAINTTVGNVTIKNNEFYVRRVGDKGIVINAESEGIHIHPSNNFRQCFRNGTIAIEDARQGPSLLTNVGSDVLVSEWLEANLALSNAGAFEEVITSGGVNWRGGKCRITAKATVLNSGTGTQRFRMKVVFQEGVNSTVIPMSVAVHIAASEQSELTSSLVVSIPYFTSTTKFKMFIQADTNNGSTVRGSANGDNTLGSTYLQVEEWH